MKTAVQILQKSLPATPFFAIQLGSGLGFLADLCENPIEIPYEQLPGFPKPTVQGHGGKVVFGTLEGVSLLFLSGRAHYYEGHDIKEVTFPVKVLHELGIQHLFLTNAAGAVNTAFQPGDLMMITDHINLSGINPLRGANDETDGPRFPDQSAVYKPMLQNILRESAKKSGVNLREGVYLWFSGPSYETPAEVRMARVLGADAVGMSTVPEAMTANRLGMQVCGISMITNMAAGILDQPLDHNEVLETAEISSKAMKRLFLAWIQEVKEYARD